ncbi:MAG TPA: class I SAM-dependent methyltransferase [Ktedonobacterales bacterium]|jgi:2-polyprenyl-3-methyl-5-hydroxy-6-metoxy-1,4-benzoquinol methylase
MRFGTIPQNPLEWVILSSGLVPTPLLDTYAVAWSRVIMAATQLKLFETLSGDALTANEVATHAGADARATEKLLNVLVGLRYLHVKKDRYQLAAVARRWLLSSSPHSVRDNVLQRYVEWRWMEHIEEFVQHGTPLDVHATMSREDWGLYQRGMRAQASFAAPEVARRTPVPRGAQDLLDIGGSHGYFSVLICRRHPSLRSTVLDLPEAVEHAAPLLAAEGMGDRVAHRAGNVLTEDLGGAAYDVVFIYSLLHHFDDQTNRELMRRVARALRPGGVVVIGDAIRPQSPQAAGPVGAFFDLYFALTSQAGTWTFAEMAAWQREAGLLPRKPIRMRMAPGTGLQVAMKPFR